MLGAQCPVLSSEFPSARKYCVRMLLGHRTGYRVLSTGYFFGIGSPDGI